MANFRMTEAVRHSILNDFITSLDAGTAGIINIYDGTQPATADTALSGNTLLATLTYSATSYGAPSSGVITANSITSDSSADATGTASFARIFTQSAGTVIFDCDVGTSGATINLNTVSIVTSGTVAISSSTITLAGT